jgi:hypothetical protein
MEDPIHDYASVVNEAEQQRRILAELEQAESRKPILSHKTKILLIAVAVGALAAMAWPHVKSWFMMEPLATTPGDNDTQAPPASPAPADPTSPAKPAPAPKTPGMGEDVQSGGLVLNVLALKVIPSNHKDLQVAGLLFLVSNGGQQAIREPRVTAFLYDANGRKYSSSVQEGDYHLGSEINPLIKTDRRSVFVVPENIELTRAQLVPDGGTEVSIDLRKRADDLDERLADADISQRVEGLDKSIQKIVDQHNALDPEKVQALTKALAQQQANEAQAKLLQTKKDVAAKANQALEDEQNKLDQLSSDLAGAKKICNATEKKWKSASDVVAKAQADLENANLALQDAKQEQTEANTALQQLSQDWFVHNPIRVKPMQERQRKANQEVDRCAGRADTAAGNLDIKRKVLTVLDAELTKEKGEVTRLTGQVTSETNMVEQLKKQAAAADEDVAKFESR